ncbi:MAG: GH3 auxin-responsive promoter family protein [Ferruginibacter sp.]
MKLLSPAISRLARMRLWRIQNWTNHPVAAQREVLQGLVTAAQYTFFGKKYNFSNLFSVKAFKQQVPIHEYDDLRPYILTDDGRRGKCFVEFPGELVCQKQWHHQRQKQIHSGK